MATNSSEQYLHRLFRISIVLKGLDGVLEIAGGAFFLFIPRDAINRILLFLTTHELAEDPHDWLAGLLRHAMATLSVSTKHFASIYLLGHGLIKVLLVIGLWRGDLRAYPAALTVLGAFVIYQVARLSHTRSVALLAIIILDLAIVLMIWREYRAEHKRRRERSADRT